MTNTTKPRPFYAVRVEIDREGTISSRDYVRGTTPMSMATFGEWALGNLLALTSDGTQPSTWTVVALEESEVRP